MCYVLIVKYHAVLKETSDFKEAIPLRDVWRSATMVPGAQCVMTCGAHQMLELSVFSWNYQVQVYSDMTL